MELLDSDDMKRDLLRKSAHHRQALEGEVKLITDNTEKIITNALVIGGSLALTYILLRQFTGSSKKKKKVKHKKIKLVQQDAGNAHDEEAEDTSPGIFGQVGAAIAGQASVFLLNLAKEKLMEFLQSQTEKKTQE